MNPIPRIWTRLLFGAALAMLVSPAIAQPRAWLDRDRIAAGETVTLNIESAGISQPDYAPLLRDFAVSGRSSRTQMGTGGVRTLHAAALRPRRHGRLVIPALTVGNERTRPLSLEVADRSAPAPARAGDDVFIESQPDDPAPYVQQTVGWIVRLYSAAPLISGQLDQPPPDGAALQQVGQDARYSRQIAGRRYEVIERRYQLIPERSGALTVPGARFEGRGTGGLFDEIFGGRGTALSAQAPARVLEVQPAPANAPQPWLPLRDLQLRYSTAPRELRAGSAATLTIEAVADGATSAQMPELNLPPIDGVQVFAEPVQADETFRDGRPRVKLSRRFSLVPSRAAAVTLPGVRIDWWDVNADGARTASLPPLSWTVVASSGVSGAPTASSSAGPGVAPIDQAGTGTADSGAQRGWVAATVLFAALWLITLLWALHHRGRPSLSGEVATIAHEEPTRVRRADLKRALETGDLGEVADALCAMVRPSVRQIDELLERLDDPRQREAIEALQQARWGGGDGVQARRMLREAFARGPRWRKDETPPQPLLPPLYPP